jgi:membrane-bound lytic murein transglycosylase D
MRRAIVTIVALVASTAGHPGAARGEPEPWAHAPTLGPAVQRGGVPLAFTSDVHEDPPRVAHGGPGVAWLSDVSLPDIPVRWDDRTVAYLEHFRENPRGRRSMAVWLERSRTYEPMIRERLRALGVPQGLLYVAMVESGFDPRARSGAGAVGLWQFVRATGAQYGLDANRWVDRRMDPVASTEAAGRYLRDLHKRFGTWELALAAYNMGYGALLRTMRKYNTNDYWVLARIEAGLPYETTLYVAKVMACAIVGENPEHFGFEAGVDQEPLRPEVVRVPGGVPLALLARAARASTEDLERLNPELLRGRTPPGDTPYALRIPAAAADGFHERWARLRPGQPSHRRHILRFGETLAEVATRYRTTARRLARLNAIEDPSELAPGTALLVPAVEPREPDPGSEPPVVAVPDGAFLYPERQRVFYRVAGHDTAEDIAGFFRVTVDELRRWNAIDPGASMLDGMLLQLFVPTEVDLDRALVLSPDEVRVMTLGSEAFFAYHEEQKGRVRFRYTVKPGDTLESLARRFGLAPADLTRINRFPRSTLLDVGQEIIVYAAPDRVPADLSTAARR